MTGDVGPHLTLSLNQGGTFTLPSLPPSKSSTRTDLSPPYTILLRYHDPSSGERTGGTRGVDTGSLCDPRPGEGPDAGPGPLRLGIGRPTLVSDLHPRVLGPGTREGGSNLRRRTDWRRAIPVLKRNRRRESSEERLVGYPSTRPRPAPMSHGTSTAPGPPA